MQLGDSGHRVVHGDVEDLVKHTQFAEPFQFRFVVDDALFDKRSLFLESQVLHFDIVDLVPVLIFGGLQTRSIFDELCVRVKRKRDEQFQSNSPEATAVEG